MAGTETLPPTASPPDEVDTTSSARKDPKQPKRRLAIAVVALYVVPLALAVYLLLAHPIVGWWPDLVPGPNVSSSGAGRTCELVLRDDNLTRLTFQTSHDAAEATRERWAQCDDNVLRRARDSVRADFFLVGVIVFAGAVASIRALRRVRWWVAGVVGLLATLVYLIAEIVEDALLLEFLDGGGWHEAVPWAAGVKLGAVVGVIAIFMVSFVSALSDLTRVSERKNEHTRAGSPTWLARRRARKQNASFGSFPEHCPPDLVAPAMTPLETTPHIKGTERDTAIACSGGGIRSAAFNLGALQALDVFADEDGTPRSELARVRRISAVSGGSYLAAAWVSARAGLPRDGGSQPWARRSAEEEHLRNHASYIAPGVGGKLWAAARFLFGFALNLGLVVAVAAVVFLPYGWLVDAAENVVPGAGGSEIVLPEGGCVKLPDGTMFAVLARDQTQQTSEQLRLANGTTAHLLTRSGAAKPSDGGEATASVKIEHGDDAIESTVTGPGQAEVSTDLPDSGSAQASATVEGGNTTADAGSAEPVKCPARDDRVAADAQDLTERIPGVPVANDGSKIVEGDTVRVRLAEPLAVVGRTRGCVQSQAGDECLRRDAVVRKVPGGSELIAAPKALLVLNETVISDDGDVVKACGAHACEQADVPALNRMLEIAVALAVLLGVASVAVRHRDPNRPAGQRVLKSLVKYALLFFLAVVVIPLLIVLVERLRWLAEDQSRVGGPLAVLTVLAALVAQVAPGAASTSTPTTVGRVVSWFKSVLAKLRPLLIKFAAFVAGPLLVLGIALFFGSYAAQQGINPGQLALALGVLAVLAVVVAGADLNQWSLHPYYRERLVEAFGVVPGTRQPRTPDTFTGLDTAPELVVCAAANIADDRVTAPGRSVIPWTFTHTSVGAPRLERALGTPAVVDPDRFQLKLRYYESLWTAVATSGAAFSPSMGKMSRPERALLALGNLRLGVWFPNPAYLRKPANGKWYQEHHPRPWYLAKEAFGIHKADDPWVYVTDGGHYENLGLVELLRRGETNIYCFDASGDTTDTFGTMAEAMRLAREELRIEIDFDPEDMKPENGISVLGVRAATISQWRPFKDAKVDTPNGDYPAASDCADPPEQGDPDEEGRSKAPSGERLVQIGWLVIAKLEVPKAAPFDVIDLARTLPKFPNNPTGDQLYTDRKFEAYRALGEYLGHEAGIVAGDIRATLAEPVGGTDGSNQVENSEPPIVRAVRLANENALARAKQRTERPDPGKLEVTLADPVIVSVRAADAAPSTPPKPSD